MHSKEMFEDPQG